MTEHERIDALVEKFRDDRGAMTMGEVMELLDLMIALRLREDAEENKSGHCSRCGRVRCGP